MNTEAFFSDRKMVVLLACLTCLLWGSAYPAIKIGYEMFSISPDDTASKMLFAGYRFLSAGLILLVMALFINRRKVFSLSKKDIGELSLLGLLQTAIQYSFFYIGLAHTTGVKGSILNATGTFFSVLLAHFIYQNDRLSIKKSFGCLIGFIGVMIVNFGKGSLDFHFTLLGEGFVMIAAFLLSAASIYGKKISQRMDAMILTGYQLSIGGIALILVGTIAGGSLSGFSTQSTLLMVYLILLSSIAFALWTTLLKYNRVGMITIFNFTIPIFGAVLSAIFLRENIMEWKNILALFFVCYGIWLVTHERSR